ncbi:Flagellar hook-length control protein [Alcanivorax sp. ALC70]|nr:Flagellar hook-length control protein [Alcanivorax sp. ALC70]
MSLARRGDQHMELHLNPRDLGPLSVSLKLDDHGAQAHFFSSHAPVRGAVEQAIPQLRDALAEQGIALGEAMVGDQPGSSSTSRPVTASPTAPRPSPTPVTTPP